AGGKPPQIIDDKAQHKMDPRYFLPDEATRRALTRASAGRDMRPNWVSFTGQAETHKMIKGLPDGLEILCEWNHHRSCYEPVMRNGNMVSVKLAGEDRPMQVVALTSGTGRTWTLQIPGIPNIFLANFYANESRVSGKPILVVWSTVKGEPHHSYVKKYLHQHDMSPEPTKFLIPEEKDPDNTFAVTHQIGSKRYQLKFRRLTKPDNTQIVVPVCEAQLLGANGEPVQPVPISYYHVYRDHPQVIEVDSQYFEIKLASRPKAEPILELHSTFAGSIREPSRMDKRVVLADASSSARLLVDMSAQENKFDDELQVALESSQAVHRQFVDAISGDIYEFSFLPDLLPPHLNFALRGVVRLRDGTPEDLGVMTRVVGLGRNQMIYVQLPGNQFVSFPTVPAHTLSITAHGQTLPDHIIASPWKSVEALTPAELNEFTQA
ncbi:MAG TPA: hypothetical protein VJC18_00945, partial [bacterium]|nr:hypothetical protein [bacterium]